MHHFDGTAGQTEGHRPEGGLTSPVGDGIKCGTGKLKLTCGGRMGLNGARIAARVGGEGGGSGSEWNEGSRRLGYSD
ncbi:hypothetical protein HG530_013387 [Fusarium avenaceum]|nr:hypothetical protein HG530_013387 [Fusarium avenaceum]